MTALTPAQKMQRMREKKARLGLKKVEVWVPPSGEAAVKALEQKLVRRMNAGKPGRS